MEIEEIVSKNRRKINEFIKTNWFATDMVVRGEVVNMKELDGFVIYDNEEIIGLITYRVINAECEIMSLDSLRENQGLGTILVNKVIETAKNSQCKKIKLITTNDNINALRFYQKRGFDMREIYHNSVDASRKLKPSIPLLGDFDIPIKHEIEFEMDL